MDEMSKARLFDIGNIGGNFQAGYDEAEQKRQIQQIGQMASQGNLKGASSAMMQIGTPEALQYGLQMQDMDRARADEKRARRTRDAASSAFQKGLDDGELGMEDYSAIARAYAEGGDMENAMAMQGEMQALQAQQDEDQAQMTQGILDAVEFDLNSGD